MINYSDDILITRKQTDEYSKKFGLKNTLSSLNLWAIGVGTVITGTFFGWNSGLASAGVMGFLIATILITVFYFILISVFSKLAIMLPYAGGPYAYARKGLGPVQGYFAGILTIVEFAFAAAAVTSIMDYYITDFYSNNISVNIALLCYLFFLVTDILGAKISAVMQFVFTGLAISGLIIFFIATAASIDLSLVMDHIDYEILLSGHNGVIPALPFVIWFYLCIEGICLASEETKNPKKSIKLGFRYSMLTILILNILTLLFCMSSISMETLSTARFPLFKVLEIVQPQDKVVFSVLSAIAMSNLLASLHGLLNGCSRQIFSLARAGYLPKVLSKLHPITKTPYLAILVTQILCIVLYYSFHFKILIFTASISALLVYGFVIHSYIKIRENENKKIDGNHYKKKRGYRFLYGINAILLASTAIAVVKIGQPIYLFIPFAVILLYYAVVVRKTIVSDAPEEMEARVDKILIR